MTNVSSSFWSQGNEELHIHYLQDSRPAGGDRQRWDDLRNPAEDFTSSLPDNECHYAVYDFDFTTDENCRKSKILFIAWASDTSKVRNKMVCWSSEDSQRGAGWDPSGATWQLILTINGS
ncbi:hypothetical protein SLE2022_402070 [Rubroshorea leprosula]